MFFVNSVTGGSQEDVSAPALSKTGRFGTGQNPVHKRFD